jgi:serine protease AprX
MKLVKKFLSGIPFTTYSKKVDYAARNVIAINKVKQIPIIILFRKSVDNIIETRLKRMGMKIKYILPFMNGVCGVIHISKFGNLCGILEVEKIFYDSKAHLMGSHNDLKAEEGLLQAINTKSSYLNGKGVTVSFIDSGVYPHLDLIRPRNRIIEFKDFISNFAFPYDDNGHGTACIGAGFGTSIDGKFKAAAYEANIVCAKAFDKLGSGFYSDILAAMQWIIDLKEKLNIRIVVLPFGTANFSVDFDILSIASEKLWKNNIFVCTCTGNLGPYDSSITSPGVSPFSYTSAACSTLELPPRAACFSGKGPVYSKCDKPDVIMPGVDIETLNSETSYIPKDKSLSKPNKLSVQYTQYNGTSIAASYTAAAAALVYQKLGNLSPDDVKSVLKTCTISINEVRSVQGYGIINIKKLEEI